MSDPELKSCPFCEANAAIETTVCDTVIRCDGFCGASISVDNHDSPEKAKAELIAIWNTRSPSGVVISRECALQAYTAMEYSPVTLDNRTEEFDAAIAELKQALEAPNAEG